MPKINHPDIQYSKPLPHSGRRLVTVPLMLFPEFMEKNGYDPIAWVYVDRFYDEVLFVKKIEPATDQAPE